MGGKAMYKCTNCGREISEPKKLCAYCKKEKNRITNVSKRALKKTVEFTNEKTEVIGNKFSSLKIKQLKSSIKINTSMKETGTKVKTEVTDTLAKVTEQLVKKGNSQKKKNKK